MHKNFLFRDEFRGSNVISWILARSFYVSSFDALIQDPFQLKINGAHGLTDEKGISVVNVTRFSCFTLFYVDSLCVYLKLYIIFIFYVAYSEYSPLTLCQVCFHLNSLLCFLIMQIKTVVYWSNSVLHFVFLVLVVWF